MEMICHQNVCVNPAPTFDLRLSKTFQEETVVIVGEKSSRAIVSVLDNVMRISGNCDSRRPCHAASQCLEFCRGAYCWICTSSRKKFSELTPFISQMTLTAPGCGMGGMIAGQARQKILDNIDGVEEATVDLVWDPPWEPSMMSEEAKQKLGVG